LGKGGSRGISIAADYSGHLETSTDDVKYATFGLNGLRTKAPAPKAALADIGTSVTTDGGIYVGYGNARIRGHLGFDAAHEQEFRRSKQIAGGIDLAYSGWNAMLEGSHRRTDFVDFSVSPDTAALVGIILPSAGLAGCSVTDRGIGTRLGYDGQTWTVFAAGRWNSYKKVECSFDVTAPQNSGILDQLAFEQLAGNFLLKAIGRTGGRIGRQAELLKSDMSLGFSHMLRSTNLGFDFARSKDQFGGGTQSNYELTGSHPAGTNCSIDIALGATAANSKRSPYIGFYVTVGL
jgi:hypothetical protein